MPYLVRAPIVVLLAAAHLLADARPALAQEEQPSRLGAAALGALAGTIAGGTVTLAVVVARSRAGQFVYEFDDFFGWNSVPIVVGIPAGAWIGYTDRDRMLRGVVGGAIGGAVGYGIGRLVGNRIWDPPEGTWAAGAIGLGVGVALGAITGLLWPEGDDDPGPVPSPSGRRIPLAVRIAI